MSGLVALAQHHISKAQLVKDVGREAVINFPHAASEDGTLALFLAELEKRQSEFGIVSYGLSNTTLEEVRRLIQSRNMLPKRSYHEIVKEKCLISTAFILVTLWAVSHYLFLIMVYYHIILQSQCIY